MSMWMILRRGADETPRSRSDWAMRGLYKSPQRKSPPRLRLAGLALRTGVPNRIQNVRDRDGCRQRRNSDWRIQAGNIERTLAGIRIAAVYHPSVFLAFANGASFLQHRDRPALQRPDRRPPLLHHQHRDRSCAETNPFGPSAVPAANTWQGFGIAGARLFHVFQCPCAP